MVLMQALFEGIGVPIAVYRSESVSWEVVWYASVPPVLFGIGFGARFMALLFIKSLSPLKLAVSWWAAAVAILLVLNSTNFRYEHFYLEPPFLFPLTTAGSFFLFFSLIRFSITALTAAVNRDDINSNS
jgi:hypothetical protein